MKKAIPPALLLVLAVVRLAVGDPFARPVARGQEAPQISERARAVLKDLRIGERVEGFEVLRISGPTDGEIAIELRDGDRGMRVWVTRRGARPFSAAERTERFDLFYGPPSPGTTAAEGSACLAVLRVLARRIEAGGAEGM